MNINIDLNKLGKYTKIFAALVDNLSITRTQYDNLATSYGAVGTHLETNPVFAPYIIPWLHRRGHGHYHSAYQ